MKNTTYKKIFISYRVQDTAGETGRLVDALRQHFADEQIFMDIDNLEPGADFTEAIEKSLDTCDVFLAVIGPHWTGDRDGETVRIADPNDWVRMEVGTALHRNIRVVPVLVDGGALPKPEQLPTDLQPLLRRQAMEISNKRWRYDTDQLIDFLINKAGIQPLKAASQNPAFSPPKRKRTWIYIAAGFVLAIVVLGIIGTLMPGEKKDGSNQDVPSLVSGSRQDNPSANTHSTVEQATSPANTPAGNEEANGNVGGAWQEVDEGETSTFVLKQNGRRLDVQVEMAGQAISTGSGEISNGNVELNFTLFGMPTNLKARLSGDGNALNGTYTIQANGTSQPIRLVRKTN